MQMLSILAVVGPFVKPLDGSFFFSTSTTTSTSTPFLNSQHTTTHTHINKSLHNLSQISLFIPFLPSRISPLTLLQRLPFPQPHHSLLTHPILPPPLCKGCPMYGFRIRSRSIFQGAVFSAPKAVRAAARRRAFTRGLPHAFFSEEVRTEMASTSIMMK